MIYAEQPLTITVKPKRLRSEPSTACCAETEESLNQLYPPLREKGALPNEGWKTKDFILGTTRTPTPPATETSIIFVTSMDFCRSKTNM